MVFYSPNIRMLEDDRHDLEGVGSSSLKLKEYLRGNGASGQRVHAHYAERVFSSFSDTVRSVVIRASATV